MLSELKFSIRSLLKTPGITLIAIGTLGLGIGATTAIFSVVNTTLLRPLSFDHPERLTRIYTEFPTYPNGGMSRFVASTAEYHDLQRETRSWQSVEIWSSSGINMMIGSEPVRVTATFVSGGLLPTLGVPATFGRLITPQDDMSGAPLVAVISHGLWQRSFAKSQAVLGREILLNGIKYTIVGVMPQDFRFPVGDADITEVWAPLQLDPRSNENGSHNWWVLGRLKPGVTIHQAQAELDSLVKHQAQTRSGHHLDPKEHTLTTYSLPEEAVRTVRPALRMLFGASCFLLLIACMNVANLLLVRTEVRQREIAIRGALGAGMWRLAVQFATEGALLALIGGLVGLILARVGLNLIEFAAATNVSAVQETRFDNHVMLFSVAISLLTGLIFGLTPLIHIASRNLHGTMKSLSLATTDSAIVQRFRQILVVSQLALALMLLVGMGLMLRAFWKLQQVDAGFDSKGVATMFVALPDGIYGGESARGFWANLEQRLVRLPGVQSAALTAAIPPLTDTGVGFGSEIEGYTPVQGGALPSLDTEIGRMAVIDRMQVITPGYFDSLRIRFIAGRKFDRRDDAKATPVVIVNQALARAIWGNNSALGHRIRTWNGGENWHTIVGVVADVKNNGVENPAGSEVYFPYTQVPAGAGFLRSVHIVVRSRLGLSSIARTVRREVHDIDGAVPITKVQTMDDVMSGSQARPRFLTLLLSVFSGVAMLLASVGLYGVISYSVIQRTREFGIRMALGAQSQAVLGLVLGRGLLLATSGLLIGLVGALALTRLFSGFLFGISATDPATFAAVSLTLVAVAALASYLPARRATRVDPLIALKAE